MEWIHVLTILGANISMILWSTRQARTDFLHLDRKLEENRKETQTIVKEFQTAILQETKEFHSRLCSIEERTRST